MSCLELSDEFINWIFIHYSIILNLLGSVCISTIYGIQYIIVYSV